MLQTHVFLAFVETPHALLEEDGLASRAELMPCTYHLTAQTGLEGLLFCFIFLHGFCFVKRYARVMLCQSCFDTGLWVPRKP